MGSGEGGGVRRGGVWLVSALQKGGGGGVGVDVEYFPRPEINFRQYLSSMAKCAHVLSATVFSTPGMISRRL